MFKLYDSGYVSDKGIHVGNNVKELKEKYKITETYFDYDNGMFLYVEGFSGSFRLDYNSYSNNKNYDFEQPKPETLLDNSIIDMIVIR